MRDNGYGPHYAAFRVADRAQEHADALLHLERLFNSPEKHLLKRGELEHLKRCRIDHLASLGQFEEARAQIEEVTDYTEPISIMMKGQVFLDSLGLPAEALVAALSAEKILNEPRNLDSEEFAWVQWLKAAAMEGTDAADQEFSIFWETVLAPKTLVTHQYTMRLLRIWVGQRRFLAECRQYLLRLLEQKMENELNSNLPSRASIDSLLSQLTEE